MKAQKINLNKLAKDITIGEGLKESISIAQVKEVLAVAFRELQKYHLEEVAEAISKEWAMREGIRLGDLIMARIGKGTK